MINSKIREIKEFKPDWFSEDIHLVNNINNIDEL
jgi:hypothetical protein